MASNEQAAATITGDRPGAGPASPAAGCPELAETARGGYRALVRERPSLFANPPGAAFLILLDEEDIRRAEQRTAGRLAAKGAPPEWAQVGVVYRDQYMLVLRDAVRFTDGSLGTYIRIVDPDPLHTGVVVLPVWRGQVLLVRHFRHATRRSHLETPRGFGSSAGASQDACRELQEEIGACGIRLVDLGLTYPDTGRSSGPVALFCAFVESFSSPEQQEGITEILAVTPAKLEDMIARGQVDDGLALAVYARAKARQLL